MPVKLKQGLKKEPIQHDYQKRFAEARQAVRWALSHVAEAAGVSLQAIGQFESGKQSLKLDVFLAACDAMNVRVEWVLKGVGPMYVKGYRPEVMSTRMKRAAKRQRVKTDPADSIPEKAEE